MGFIKVKQNDVTLKYEIFNVQKLSHKLLGWNIICKNNNNKNSKKKRSLVTSEQKLSNNKNSATINTRMKKNRALYSFYPGYFGINQ